MRRFEPFAWIGGLIVVVALLMPSAAQACSCVAYDNPEDQARAILEGSDGAFIGVLASKRKLENSGPFGESDLTFRVRRSFGVRLNREIKIRTSDQASACGLSGRVGRKYALGIYGKPGRWGSSSCSVMNPKALRAVAGDGTKLASVTGDPGCGTA